MTRQKNNICYTKINMLGEDHLFICQKNDFGKYYTPKGEKSLCGGNSKIEMHIIIPESEVFMLEIKRGIFYREDYHKMFIIHSLGGYVEVMPKGVCYKCLLSIVPI